MPRIKAIALSSHWRPNEKKSCKTAESILWILMPRVADGAHFEFILPAPQVQYCKHVTGELVCNLISLWGFIYILICTCAIYLFKSMCFLFFPICLLTFHLWDFMLHLQYLHFAQLCLLIWLIFISISMYTPILHFPLKQLTPIIFWRSTIVIKVDFIDELFPFFTLLCKVL